MAAKSRRSDRLTATQARAARRTRRRTRRRFIRYAAISGVGLIALAFIVALFLPSFSLAGGGSFGGFLGGGAPDGPGLRMDDIGTTHIASGDDHPPYNSVPATSGWHYGQPFAPARWGIHDTFLEDEVLIHNLEHGGIAISYNCPDGCDELVGQLAELVDEGVRQGGKVIMSPNTNTASVITLTAWTFIDEFDVFDEDRVRDFVGSHESSTNAPEPNAR
jgi:hypothetical protein